MFHQVTEETSLGAPSTCRMFENPGIHQIIWQKKKIDEQTFFTSIVVFFNPNHARRPSSRINDGRGSVVVGHMRMSETAPCYFCQSAIFPLSGWVFWWISRLSQETAGTEAFKLHLRCACHAANICMLFQKARVSHQLLFLTKTHLLHLLITEPGTVRKHAEAMECRIHLWRCKDCRTI